MSHSLLVILAELEPMLSGFRIYSPNHYAMDSDYKCITQALSSENLSLVGIFPVYYPFKMGAPSPSSSCSIIS